MSRIARRDMLKVMAATAAGAAVSGTGIESVLAVNLAPSAGSIIGVQPRPTLPSLPKIASPTPFTTYLSVFGAAFEAELSFATWSVIRGVKYPSNGGVYFARLQLPQGALITECTFYLANPSVAQVSCSLLLAPLGLNGGGVVVASGHTTATSALPQPLVLPVNLFTVDNFANWHDLEVDNGAATDNQIWGARVGWIRNEGLTLFPNPRRIVSTNMVSGTTYGPIDATLQTDGVTPSGVPMGTTAAFCAVQSYTPGVLTIFPDGTTDPNIANYSGTGNLGSSLNMLYMMVPLSILGKFKIHSYITGGVYLDVWGFVV